MNNDIEQVVLEVLGERLTQDIEIAEIIAERLKEKGFVQLSGIGSVTEKYTSVGIW